MKKELREYLHLYLPVKVELNNGGSKVYNRTAVAVGNMDDKFSYVTLRMGQGANAFTHSIFFNEDNRVKMILKPIEELENLSDEQYNQIEQCLSEFPTYTFLNCLISKREIAGNGWSLFKVNQAVNLLRKWGFDCDGLIDVGLAANSIEFKAVI